MSTSDFGCTEIYCSSRGLHSRARQPSPTPPPPSTTNKKAVDDDDDHDIRRTIMRSCFIEIIDPNSQKEHELPEWIDCYIVTNIDCKICEPLARELNKWQRECTTRHGGPTSSTISSSPPSVDDNFTDFPKIEHLKRIRRRPATSDEIELRNKSEEAKLRRQQPPVAAVAAAAASNAIANATPYGSNGESSTLPPPSSLLHETNTGEHHATLPTKKKNNKKRNRPEASTSAAATALWSLDLLLGSIAAIDYFIQTATSSDDLSTRLHSILERYNIHPHSSNEINIKVVRQHLPGRPAKTKEERLEWNTSLWPTLFFEEQTSLYKEKQLELTNEEMNMMRLGLKEAVNDAMVGREQWNEWNSKTAYATESTQQVMMTQIVGAVVMNPQTCSIVSRASDERSLQGMPENGNTISNTTDADPQKSTTPTTNHTAKSWSTFPDEANPMLCTPILLAIQGVSRKERNSALGCGIESMEFQAGQYLCTGYDVYLTKEPNVYESMALVHSRVRRVVFGVQDREMGGLGGIAEDATTTTNGQHNNGIHSLPGTNHHYRAFRFDMMVNSGGEGDEEIAALKATLMQLHREDVSP
ncbi:hypothetical protein ACHAXH_001555 [Discostella pseudostelligera]